MAGGIWIRHDFHSGKLTARGRPNPDLRRYETVCIVTRDSIDRLLGTRTLQQRIRLLRGLRDESGILIVSQNPKSKALTHTVRGDSGKRFRAYVFSVPHPDYIAVEVERLRKSR